MPAIADRERVEKQVGVLLAAADRIGVPILATEQYPKGLGGTVEALAAARNQPLAAFVAEVDAARPPGQPLASALRLAALRGRS